MMKMFRTAICVALLAMTAASASAWSVQEDWRDPINGRLYTVAATTNDDGMSIAIFRDVDGKVRAVYSLPASSFDRVRPEGHVMSIRPGQMSVADINAAYSDPSYMEMARSDGRNVRASIWHGQDPSPSMGTLRNILDSDTLFARFYTETNTTIDTVWSLDGASDAISEAVGIAVNADPETIAFTNLQTELLVAAAQRCATDSGCFSKVTVCMDMLKTVEDEPAFSRCVEAIFSD